MIDGLSGEHTCGTDFIDDLTGLVEHKSENVLVVADGDDALQHKFTGADHNSAICAIICVLPADASILLMNTHAVLYMDRATCIIGYDSGEVVNASKTVTAELEIVRHGTRTGVT